jgi:hypothetical protein
MERHQDLKAEDSVFQLVVERAKFTSMDAYLGSIVRRYRQSGALNYLHDVAAAVEPIDRALGVDRQMPAANAFFKGAMLGFHISIQSSPPKVRRKILQVVIHENSGDDDEFQRAHDVAESIIDLGEEAYTLVPELAELIEEWEDQLSPDIRYQPFVRRGFGVLMYMMNEAYVRVAQEEIERGAQTGSVDWDAELGSL